MHRTKSLSGPFFQNTGGGVCIKSTGNYYAPGMPGAGVRAYAIDLVDPDRVRIYFSACVNAASFTGIETRVNNGVWQQVTGVVKVNDQIYTWQSATGFTGGDIVQWRYLGGTDSIVDCVDSEDIGEQGPLTEVAVLAGDYILLETGGSDIILLEDDATQTDGIQLENAT